MQSVKVTALIPSGLIKKVESYTQGANLTECLVIALSDWVAKKKLASLNNRVASRPLLFKEGFSASQARKINQS